MLIVTITVLILTIFFSYYIRKLSVEKMVEQYENLTQQFFEEFMGYYNKIDVNIDNFITNDYVQKTLTNGEIYAFDREMVVQALTFLGNDTDYYVYMDNKGNCYSPGSVPEDIEKVKKQLVGFLGDDYSKTKLVSTIDLFPEQQGERLYACRYIRPMNQVHKPGILIMRLKEDFMNKEQAKLDEEDASFFIVNSDNKVCMAKRKIEREIDNKVILLLTKEEHILNINKVTRKEGLITICQDNDSGFKGISHVGYTVLMRTFYQTLFVVAVVFVLILILTLFISVKISHWIAKPIEKINRYMLEFCGTNMENYIEIHTGTELDSIGNSYNLMLDKIRSLLDEVRFRETELRKSEMNSLIYQMNPHFLYNTLDTINMLARIHQEKEIMQMIQSLTRLLRINLSNGADLITVKEELDYVKAYMDIMKFRNNNLFTYEISWDENLEPCQIIKLILQPIVENCIKHGFKEISEGGRIIIHAEKNGDNVEFTVKNNGYLIGPENINILNHLMQQPMHNGDTEIFKTEGGYGIRNVIKRLRLYYTKNICFHYEIQEGFTVCSIRIPMEDVYEKHI